MSLDCTMYHKALQIAEACYIKAQKKHLIFHKMNTEIQYPYIKINDLFARETCSP